MIGFCMLKDLPEANGIETQRPSGRSCHSWRGSTLPIERDSEDGTDPLGDPAARPGRQQEFNDSKTDLLPQIAAARRGRIQTLRQRAGNPQKPVCGTKFLTSCDRDLLCAAPEGDAGVGAIFSARTVGPHRRMSFALGAGA